MIHLRHGDSALTLDPAVGNIPDWQVVGRHPLHAAPWRDEAEVQDDPAIPPRGQASGGRFPVHALRARRRGGAAPIHGPPPANAPWAVIRQDVAEAHLAPYGAGPWRDGRQAGRDPPPPPSRVRSSTRLTASEGRAGRGQLRPSPDDPHGRGRAAVVFRQNARC